MPDDETRCLLDWQADLQGHFSTCVVAPLLPSIFCFRVFEPAFPEHSDGNHPRPRRTHNLKNINLDLRRDQCIVITGLSGSG